MHDFYKRYLQGQTQQVWQELIELGPTVIQEPYQQQVHQILALVNQRLRLNLHVIHSELLQQGYVFTDFKDGCPLNRKESPVVEWGEGATNKFLEELKQQASPYGEIPLLFTSLFKVVKSVNFSGYFPTWQRPPALLDPLVIYPLDGILALNLEGNEPFKHEQGYCLVFCPDDYLKQDISGSLGYGISLLPQAAIDGQVVFYSQPNLFLMDYLRLCCHWAGFPTLEWFDKEQIPANVLAIISSIRQQMSPI